jgi:hypothetical protein
MTYYTTLNKIREHRLCADSWGKLLRNLGRNVSDNKPIPLITILDSNGVEDAIWCLRTCDGIDREARLFVVWCARQVQHLMTDSRSIAALDVAERHANDEATDDELHAAWIAARAALDDARNATLLDSDVARAAAWASSLSPHVAAWAAARDVAWALCVAANTASEALDAAQDAQEAEFRRMFCCAESAAIAKAEGKE